MMKKVKVKFIKNWQSCMAGEIYEMVETLASHLEKQGFIIRLTDISVPERH